MFSGWGLSWGGWLDNRRGEWWLMAQLLLIGAHLVPAWPATTVFGLQHWPRPIGLMGAVLFFAGLCLAFRALQSLGSRLSPLPEPKQGNQLICSGAYQHCRHPMYQAVLICSLGVGLGLGSLVHLLLLLALAVVLGRKARREEQTLLRLHPDYAGYRRDTAAIIPNLPWLDWH